MKIQKVKFKNFRNVPDQETELNGCNIILLAENTKGKSNFIKGIQAALAGKVGLHAIKDGEKRAEVELLMAKFEKDQPIEGTNYTFRLEVYKDKGNEEKVKLEVTAPNGFKETKKTVIGTIAGEVELDYNFVELGKTSAGKKKQLEIIKSYMDEETRGFLALHENKAQQIYDERTEVGREIKSLEGFIASCGLNDMDFVTYAEKKDTTVIDKQIADASKINAQISEVKSRMEDRNKRHPIVTAEIIELEKKVAALRGELVDMAEKNSQASKWLKENPEVNVTALQEERNLANDHNMKHQKVADLTEKRKTLEKCKEQAGEMTAHYESTKQAIADAIRDWPMPIEGISFDSEAVYYKGKLVDESCMSTSEIMMLEAELKMAKMPGAEVVFVQRGESLGMGMLQQLQVTAKERGYQLVMEQVERGTEELRVEFMPDYSAKAVVV